MISDTHRLDSDLDVQFGNILDVESNHKIAPSRTVRWIKYNSSFYNDYIKGLANKKQKGGAWFVSHCKASSMRDRVMMELRKYIDIDIYGKCYNETVT